MRSICTLIPILKKNVIFNHVMWIGPLVFDLVSGLNHSTLVMPIMYRNTTPGGAYDQQDKT